MEEYYEKDTHHSAAIQNARTSFLGLERRHEVNMKKGLAAIGLAAVMIFAETLGMAACGKEEEKLPPVNEDNFNYETLYSNKRTTPYEQTERLTSRASYGYWQSSVQGYNGWYYLSYSNGNYVEMSYSDGKWTGGGASLENAVMTPAADSAAVRKYVVSQDGKATIYGNYKSASADSAAAQIEILVNDEGVYTGVLSAGDTAGKYFELPVTLSAGDEVSFRVSEGSVEFNPVVTFETAQNSSLYHMATVDKMYGDVFPWYDEETQELYMWYLWSDDPRVYDYNWTIDTTTNLLWYRNLPEANNYDKWQKYRENYKLNDLYNCGKFIDYSVYPGGTRDSMLYYDAENERYLMVAGAYYVALGNGSPAKSDLVIVASNDKFAMSWTKPAVFVDGTYESLLPECPSLIKIGNRWYPFVSVAYVTAHQVGPLQYWVGDDGVDCLDVNWAGKEYLFLDGEDLCAARPTYIGDKVYMWGWIPATYDTMPWVPWGGYLNLPREVIQRTDGTLGGRLDPALSSILNYGNILTLGEGNYTVTKGTANYSDGALAFGTDGGYASLGNYHRTYSTFRLEMNGSKTAGISMQQGDQEYQVVLVREKDGMYLKVLSPNDPKHKVNSYIKLHSEAEVYDIQIVNDGEFIEFFVNGENALTAHTAMTGTVHVLSLFADGNAAFHDVKINKLLPYGECEV